MCYSLQVSNLGPHLKRFDRPPLRQSIVRTRVVPGRLVSLGQGRDAYTTITYIPITSNATHHGDFWSLHRVLVRGQDWKQALARSVAARALRKVTRRLNDGSRTG
ncbi:hypothetical protein CMUS01_01567 [Colletotrichum musicola]|uniref:Uncharacterized protein n=1 Tax=Colletotrichum musicola TaxID=2175873 RepID=A0A8H6U7Z6_9PEZI|nr:hypothetical protein CMUS01_01567 [Colletotrichum musicola]